MPVSPSASRDTLRVLMLSWEYVPNVIGGLGQHVTALVRAMGNELARRPHHEIHVLTPRVSPVSAHETLGPNVHIHRFPWPQASAVHIYDNSGDLFGQTMQANERLVETALMLARDRTFDLLHVHDWLPVQAALELGHIWHVPLVSTIHATEKGRHRGYLANELSWKIHGLEESLCQASRHIIVCSHFMRGMLMDTFHVPAPRLRVIPNGIEDSPFRECPPAQMAQLARQFKAQGEFLLLFIGRQTHEKGLHVLMDALPGIRARHPKVRLLVVGRNSERLEEEIAWRGLDEAITLLGFVADRVRNGLLQVADMLIVPSLYEPFGIVALEAMAAGCPVIASHVGGLAEVVTHEKTGLTIYPNDPDSICWAVDQILTHPLQARQRAQNAQQVIRTKFGWPRIVQRTLAVYDLLREDRADTRKDGACCEQ